MLLKGAALSFSLADGESLMSLVNTCGYSKPTKDDPIARRTLTGYGDGSGEDASPVIEVHRKSEHQVFVSVRPGDFPELTHFFVYEAWGDLAKAGLV
jgi:hypothetical protein